MWKSRAGMDIKENIIFIFNNFMFQCFAIYGECIFLFDVESIYRLLLCLKFCYNHSMEEMMEDIFNFKVLIIEEEEKRIESVERNTERAMRR